MTDETGTGPRRSRRRDPAAWLRLLAGLLLVAITVLTILQVMFRFLLNSPLVWSEEVARLCIVWMTFLGAAVCCWDGTHLRVGALADRLPGRLGTALHVVSGAMIVAFLAVLVWTSIPLVQISNLYSVGALDIPVSWYRAPVTVGGTLMIAFLAARWWSMRARGRGKSEPPASALDDLE